MVGGNKNNNFSVSSGISRAVWRSEFEEINLATIGQYQGHNYGTNWAINMKTST